jgi:hypothetical protein
MNEITKYYIRNGLYIPFLHIYIYYITNNLFLSTIIALKIYSANYFYWFSHYYKYKNIPKKLYFLKQFVRFTDTGHIVSFIYFLNPKFYPIAYNIHFIITFGYWIGKLCFKIEDKDDLNISENIKIFENVWSYSNHLIPLILLVRELWIKPELCNYNIFIFKDLYFSYLWLYTWYYCIYTPWNLITKDYVYNVFSPKTPIKYKIYTILFMHILILISNKTGKVLQNIRC